VFFYHLKIAWLSFKKTPVLSALIIGAIALGIGVCVSVLTVYSLMTKNPVAGYSDQLFTYKLNNQPPVKEGGKPVEARSLVSYRDAMNIAGADIEATHSLHYQTAAVYYPQKQGVQPFRSELRLANQGFFKIHRVPFLYGTSWSVEDERSNPYQTILTKDLNDQLFRGENSIGKEVKIANDFYKVTGVLDNYKPLPKYMEIDSGPFAEIEGAFVPFSLTPQLAMRKRNGDIRCPGTSEGDDWQAFLEADCYWLHHWVELKDQSSQNAFKQHLDDYAFSQRNYGRFMGPYNNELHNVMSWLGDQNVVNQDYEFLLGIAFLFLIVCLLNCIGLLLTKFMGKSGETALRRAVGASRKMIFRQYLIEVSLIGFLGGCIGLLLSLIGLASIRSLYQSYEQLTHLNLQLIITAIVLSIGTTLLAGLLPAWRISRLPAAQYLKSQ
jgi:putative ABC transport system permease protein